MVVQETILKMKKTKHKNPTFISTFLTKSEVTIRGWEKAVKGTEVVAARE